MPSFAQQTVDCRTAALLDAADLGDVEAVCQILDDRTNNNLKADAAQWTLRRLAPRLGELWPGWSAQPAACALHCAAQHGHEKVVGALLERGAPVAQETRHGVTPLHLASFGGHAEVVTLLLTHSADPNPCCRDLFGASGPSPLHLAGGSAFELWPGSSSVATVATTRWQRQHRGSTSSGRDSAGEDINGARCAMLLLDAGASVHAVDMSTGRTPLHYAALQRNPALCACLVRAGAWLQVLDAGGETPISLARQERSKRSASSHDEHVDAGERRTTATDQEMAAAAVLQELRWLPAVRTLWLGHIKGDITSAAGTESRDEGLQSPLRRLSRDVVRLIAQCIVRNHAPLELLPSSLQAVHGGVSGELDLTDSTGPQFASQMLYGASAEQVGVASMTTGLAEISLAVRTMHESTV